MQEWAYPVDSSCKKMTDHTHVREAFLAADAFLKPVLDRGMQSLVLAFPFPNYTKLTSFIRGNKEIS